MIDITLVTDEQSAGPPAGGHAWEEDRPLFEALAAAGVRVERKAWSNPDVDWSGSRLIVLRTTWDYFHRIDAFRGWLDRVEPAGNLINDAALVRWNLDKHYLLELAESGLPIVPTVVVEPNQRTSLGTTMADLGWQEIVFKPAVSASGFGTERVAVEHLGSAEKRFQDLLKRGAMLVQPFARDIVSAGEASLMVIEGQVTHAVRKLAAEGEFRVQAEHGGRVVDYSPTVPEIELARSAVAACRPLPLIARVDLVGSGDDLRLMELELIEPELFLPRSPETCQALVRALLSRLSQ